MEETWENVGESDGADGTQQRGDVEKVVLQKHGEDRGQENQRSAEEVPLPGGHGLGELSRKRMREREGVCEGVCV